MTQQHAPKNPAQQDWHRADVKAALEKAGWSLRRLAAHHGYASRCTLVHALDRPWPKGQALIAEAIGVAPETIWPSRYPRQKATDGSPNADVLTHRLANNQIELLKRVSLGNSQSKDDGSSVSTAAA